MFFAVFVFFQNSFQNYFRAGLAIAENDVRILTRKPIPVCGENLFLRKEGKMFLNYAEFLFKTNLVCEVKYLGCVRARVTVHRYASGRVGASVSVQSEPDNSVIFGGSEMTVFVKTDMIVHFSEMGIRVSDGYSADCSQPIHGGCVLTISKD